MLSKVLTYIRPSLFSKATNVTLQTVDYIFYSFLYKAQPMIDIYLSMMTPKKRDNS